MGLPVFLIKKTSGPTTMQIWKGMISSNTTLTLTVDEWIPMFNAVAAPSDGAYTAVVIGGLFYYFKTPIYNLPDKFTQKLLKRLEVFSNVFSSGISYDFDLAVNTIVNQSQKNAYYLLTFEDDDDMCHIPFEKERHRYIQMEFAGVSVQELDIKAISFHLVRTGSKLDSKH